MKNCFSPLLSDKLCILIVDNDRKILDILVRNFSLLKIKTYTAKNNKEALGEFKKFKPDIVILDWMLGNESGLDVCDKIRGISDTPILMLTSKTDCKDIALALDGGVDDYLTKPFSLNELNARIRNLSMRGKKLIFKKTKIILNNLSIDLKNHLVKTGDRLAYLTKTEYKILLHLLLNKNYLVSKEDIRAHLFDVDVIKSDHLVNMHIFNLKKKLGDSLDIKTVPYQGFIVREN